MVSNWTEGELASECTRLYSQTTFRNWQIIYQSRIKGLEFILGLRPSLGEGGGVDNRYWPSLGDWLDLRPWPMSCNRAEVTSTLYWVKWRHFQTYLAYFLILASDLIILEYMSLVDSDASSPFVRLITISIFRKIISIFFKYSYIRVWFLHYFIKSWFLQERYFFINLREVKTWKV